MLKKSSTRKRNRKYMQSTILSLEELRIVSIRPGDIFFFFFLSLMIQEEEDRLILVLGEIRSSAHRDE